MSWPEPPKTEAKTDPGSQALDASKAFEADTARLRELAQFATSMWGNLNGNPFNQDSEGWKKPVVESPDNLIRARDRALIQVFEAIGRIARRRLKAAAS